MVVERAGFSGVRVAVFEHRHAEAMARAVERCGGQAVSAPAMQEAPLGAHPEAYAFAEQLFAGAVNVLVCLTGVGTQALIDTLSARYDRERLLDALRRVTIVARGPKPAQVLAAHGIPIAVTVPEPNTWRELIAALDESERSLELDGCTVAIQEYGEPNTDLMAALADRGARVMRVPVYRWALPDDTTPLMDAIQRIIDGEIPIVLFTSAVQIRHVLRVAAERGLEGGLREALRRVVVGSIGPTTTEAIRECDVRVDFEPSRPKMGVFVSEVAAQSAALARGVATPRLSRASPVAAEARDTRAQRAASPFLRACRRQAAPVTPIWLMRQAGRYLPEYRRVRNTVSFAQLCRSAELAAEVTVTAAERLRVDAAIIFSDILLIVEPLGFNLQYTANDGPVISGRLATLTDVDRLREIVPGESLRFVFDAVRLARATLDPAIPLIGFSGAPFTLASYIIEGGTSRSFMRTKRLMYADPPAWHALMEKIGRGLVGYLNGQIEAGADVVQLFDSWVGCLSAPDYREFVLPHTQAVIRGLRGGVPVIHFGTGTAPFLKEVRQAGGEVIGIDYRAELDCAWQTIGYDVGIMGNLDPAVLLADRATIQRRVQRVLDQAGGRPGHIFNLGHGVLPATPVDHVVALVEMVHELSARH